MVYLIQKYIFASINICIMVVDSETLKNREKFLKINLLHIGKGIKALRKINKMTLDDMYVETGIDKAQMSRLENSITGHSFTGLSNILAVHNMTFKEFFDALDALIE